MKKLLAAAGLIALNAAAPAAYAAQQWPLWYVGLSGGVTFLQDSDIGGTTTGDLTYDMGGSGLVSLGYMIPSSNNMLSNFRIEAEIGYHYNTLDTYRLGAGAVTSARDRLQSWSLMANAYYDFRNQSAWTPYLGAGVGVARAEIGENSGLGNTEDTDNALAYQFMAGLAYAPKSIPQTEWSLGYRYYALDGPSFRTSTGRITIDDASSHSAEIGARFRF